MTRAELQAIQDGRRQGVRDGRAATGHVHEAKDAVSATGQWSVITRERMLRRAALKTESPTGADAIDPMPLPGTTRRAGSMERLHPECRQMLEAAGFTYDERLDAWFNLPDERAIACDRVADRSPEGLAEWLAHE